MLRSLWAGVSGLQAHQIAMDVEGNNILGTSIQSQKLEGSNVKYSTALTELMIMQKAFDASAKSITTSDEMIKNAINMKR